MEDAARQRALASELLQKFSHAHLACRVAYRHHQGEHSVVGALLRSVIGEKPNIMDVEKWEPLVRKAAELADELKLERERSERLASENSRLTIAISRMRGGDTASPTKKGTHVDNVERAAAKVAEALEDTCVGEELINITTAYAELSAAIAALLEHHKRYEHAIRRVRDMPGHDRCWKDLDTLYELLPEGYVRPAGMPSVSEMLIGCKAFVTQCRHPDVPDDNRAEDINTLLAFKSDALQLRAFLPSLMPPDSVIAREREHANVRPDFTAIAAWFSAVEELRRRIQDSTTCDHLFLEGVTACERCGVVHIPHDDGSDDFLTDVITALSRVALFMEEIRKTDAKGPSMAAAWSDLEAATRKALGLAPVAPRSP